MPHDPVRLQAALDEGRAWRCESELRPVFARGADALDLLQRLSASDLAGLQPPGVRAALFTDEKGRVVDLAQLALPGGAPLLLPGPGRAEALIAWLERFVILEDARFLPMAGACVLRLLGRPARAAAAGLLGLDFPEDGELTGDAERGWLVAEAFPGGVSHLVLPAPLDPAEFQRGLAQAGLVEVDENADRRWAIARGRVEPGVGLASGVNPLEAGLRPAVSFQKGCYVGQEVVARLDSYQKVRRRLVRLRWRGRPPEPGMPLVEDERKRGLVILAAADDGDHGTALAPIDVDRGEGTRLAYEGGTAELESVITPA